MDSPLLLCLAASIAAYVIYCTLRQHPPYPPGPPSKGILGNYRQIPKSSEWKTYAEWAKRYNSDVLSFTSFGKRMIILHSAEVATELLDRRGSIYSGRDHNVMLQDLMGTGNTSVVFMQYTARFRLHRKVMNTALNNTAVRDYFPIQEKETYSLLNRLLVTPDNWRAHLRRMAASTILTMTYGHQVTSDDDYLVKMSEASSAMFLQAISPTSFLVNLLPALKHIPDWDWLPGTQFKRFAKEGRRLRISLRNIPFNKVKEQLAAGVAFPSYTAKLLDAKGTVTGDIDEEQLIKVTASAMYAAGSDTSVTSLTNLILALVLHPEVQKKVQAELDSVIGTTRLPTFEDQSSLLYLEMVISESLRWNPVVPMGIPHAVQQDDTYNVQPNPIMSMFIPKGSVIMPNIWAMLHDEKMYPEPFKFWPERFDGRFPNIRHPRSFVFGFNRRLCPGRHLALNSLFIQAANLLAVYNFLKPRDENGKELEPLVDYSGGTPKPFKCTITPRSKVAEELIRSTAGIASF